MAAEFLEPSVNGIRLNFVDCQKVKMGMDNSEIPTTLNLFNK